MTWRRSASAHASDPGDFDLAAWPSRSASAFSSRIKAAGARLLFLPKYSPDLNPIEQVFAKLKAHVRKAAPRTLDAVADAIAKARAQISPDECANYLENTGYGST